jgi:hypothetical protein
MTNRKKRIEKGVKSLELQINLHKEKLEKAREDGELELADYYECEINGLEKSKNQKQKLLDKL